MNNYTYKCPACGHEQDINSSFPNELVYCIKCRGNHELPSLMNQIKVNKDINVSVLLEDDHK